MVQLHVSPRERAKISKVSNIHKSKETKKGENFKTSSSSYHHRLEYVSERMNEQEKENCVYRCCFYILRREKRITLPHFTSKI